MGRVERSARFSVEKYNLEVPEFAAASESDGNFDASDVAPFEPDEEASRLYAELGEAEAPKAEAHVDWAALQSDTDALIDNAARDARNMLEDSYARAQLLVEEAQGRVAAIETKAEDAGRLRGETAARADVQAEAEPMVQTLRDLIVSARQERHAIIEGAEGELLKLAMVIAERIVHQQVSADPAVVVENIRSALARLVSREVVTLRVNPIDLDMVRQHRDAIVASNDIEHLRIVEDQRVDRGGVVLETDSGTIDSKVSTQLREARKALHGDETPALGTPSTEEHLHSPAQAS